MRTQFLKIVLHMIFIVIIMVILTPLIWMFISSLKSAEDLMSASNILPKKINIENYTRLFKETAFLKYLLNSLIVGLVVAIACTSLAALASYAYARVMFAGKKILGILTFLVYMISPVMIVIPLYLLFRSLFLGNTIIALIIAHTTFVFPFAFWILNSYIKSFPIELEKAARIDGAGFFLVFFKIVVPNLIQGITSVAVFSFILSWNDYVFARVLITGDDKKTLPVGIEDMFSATVTDWSIIMVAGVIVSLPIIAGYIAVSKYIDKAIYLKYY